jgi:hypothetical protein
MMTSPNLENLVKSGQLKREEGDQREFDGLVRSARARLIDARKHALSIESRFDLAYNSAHALSLAALRWHGYRSDNRYLVFQCLPHTLGLGPEVWRVLALCHQRRNRGEYEGFLEVDEQLVNDLIEAAGVLDAAVAELRPLQ